MDENTWRFAQLMMWLIGLQTAMLVAVLGAIWVHINKRFDDVNKRFEDAEKKTDKRFDDMESRQLRLEGDMIEVKTILRMKECCMIQDERQLKKAE